MQYLFCAQSSIKVVRNFDLFCFIASNLLLQWVGSQCEISWGSIPLGDFSTRF
jgi:hypothetical protein